MAKRAVLAIAMAAFVSACGGGGGGGDAPDANLPTSAEASSDTERVAYPLQAGRYRIAYRAPGCDSPTISVTQDGGDFAFTRVNPATSITFVDDVPNGSFFIEVTGCDEWSMKLAQI